MNTEQGTGGQEKEKNVREAKRLTCFSPKDVVAAAQAQGKDREQEQEAAQGTGVQSRRRTAVRQVFATVQQQR
jgi:hypothetical protein